MDITVYIPHNNVGIRFATGRHLQAIHKTHVSEMAGHKTRITVLVGRKLNGNITTVISRDEIQRHFTILACRRVIICSCIGTGRNTGFLAQKAFSGNQNLRKIVGVCSAGILFHSK